MGVFGLRFFGLRFWITLDYACGSEILVEQAKRSEIRIGVVFERDKELQSDTEKAAILNNEIPESDLENSIFNELSCKESLSENISVQNSGYDYVAMIMWL